MIVANRGSGAASICDECIRDYAAKVEEFNRGLRPKKVDGVAGGTGDDQKKT